MAASVKKKSSIRKKRPATKASTRKPALTSTKTGLSQMPQDLQPMLVTLVTRPVDEHGWTYEIKWDGYRTIAYLNNGKATLRSRNNKSFDEKFYPIYEALKKWKIRAVLDGEIIVANEKGISNFGDLQNWRSEADGHLSFYVFDLLWLDGINLMELPLSERREKLRSILPENNDHIFLSDNFEATGGEFFEAANKMGLEGIIAKKADSPYVPGARSKVWLKIKTQQKQEAVIAGYTKNENTSRQFSALLLGWYEDGAIRHPSFEGLRTDKKASEVVREKPKALKELADPWGGKKPLTKKRGKAQRKTLLNPTEKTQVREIDGHEIKFNNLDKLYWPKEKVTKRDMLNYYYQVSPYILPYMKDRPQTLNRFPNGIKGESFYQKDITGKAPGWIKPFPYYSEQDQRKKNFLVCTNEASLLYIASLGCIEMNPWSSRIQKPDNPDWCIIDLDPSDKNSFEQVIETALVTRQVLDTFGVTCCCKTSGSTGIHIYIPLGARYSYEESKEFGRLIAKLVHAELPQFTSIERYTRKRKGKLYIDFLQNRPQATLATAYSLRPKPGAPVSAPLYWEEVKKGMKILDFTIFNMMDRLKETGDLFKPVLGKAINLKTVKKEMEKLVKTKQMD